MRIRFDLKIKKKVIKKATTIVVAFFYELNLEQFIHFKGILVKVRDFRMDNKVLMEN